MDQGPRPRAGRARRRVRWCADLGPSAAMSRPLGASDNNAGRTAVDWSTRDLNDIPTRPRTTGGPAGPTRPEGPARPPTRRDPRRPSATARPETETLDAVRRLGPAVRRTARSTAGIPSRPVGATSPARRRPTAGEARRRRRGQLAGRARRQTSRYAFHGRRRACWRWSAWSGRRRFRVRRSGGRGRDGRLRHAGRARRAALAGEPARRAGSTAWAGPALRPRGGSAGRPARPTRRSRSRPSTSWAGRTGCAS